MLALSPLPAGRLSQPGCLSGGPWEPAAVGCRARRQSGAGGRGRARVGGSAAWPHGRSAAGVRDGAARPCADHSGNRTGGHALNSPCSQLDLHMRWACQFDVPAVGAPAGCWQQHPDGTLHSCRSLTVTEVSSFCSPELACLVPVVQAMGLQAYAQNVKGQPQKTKEEVRSIFSTPEGYINFVGSKQFKPLKQQPMRRPAHASAAACIRHSRAACGLRLAM